MCHPAANRTSSKVTSNMAETLPSTHPTIQHTPFLWSNAGPPAYDTHLTLWAFITMNALLGWLGGYGKNPNNTQLLQLVRQRVGTRASPVRTSLRQVVHRYRACSHAGPRHILYIRTLHCYMQQHAICQFLLASEIYARALCLRCTIVLNARSPLQQCVES